MYCRNAEVVRVLKVNAKETVKGNGGVTIFVLCQYLTRICRVVIHSGVNTCVKFNCTCIEVLTVNIWIVVVYVGFLEEKVLFRGFKA